MGQTISYLINWDTVDLSVDGELLEVSPSKLHLLQEATCIGSGHVWKLLCSDFLLSERKRYGNEGDCFGT